MFALGEMFYEMITLRHPFASIIFFKYINFFICNNINIIAFINIFHFLLIFTLDKKGIVL